MRSSLACESEMEVAFYFVQLETAMPVLLGYGAQLVTATPAASMSFRIARQKEFGHTAHD